MTRREARVDAIRRGLWQTSSGEMIPLGAMPAPHLVNAYLRVLVNQDTELEPHLAREVVRRGLQLTAWREATRRMEARS